MRLLRPHTLRWIFSPAGMDTLSPSRNETVGLRFWPCQMRIFSGLSMMPMNAFIHWAATVPSTGR
jgi:hypothetical protein